MKYRANSTEPGGESEEQGQQSECESEEACTAKTKVVQVPESEKERRMTEGQCVKCGKAGHKGKDCWTGWKYDPASTPTATAAVTTIAGVKRRYTSNQQSQPQKRRLPLTDQPNGSIKTIASRIEESTDSDSGNE